MKRNLSVLAFLSIFFLHSGLNAALIAGVEIEDGTAKEHLLATWMAMMDYDLWGLKDLSPAKETLTSVWTAADGYETVRKQMIAAGTVKPEDPEKVVQLTFIKAWSEWRSPVEEHGHVDWGDSEDDEL